VAREGPAAQGGEPPKLKVDLFGTITPTVSQYFAPHHIAAIGTSYVDDDIAENGSYLGIPLVVLLPYLLYRIRRDRFVMTVAFMGLVAYVLSLGSSLNVGGHTTGVPLPFAIMTKLPVIDNLIASRFSLYVALAAAFVFAIAWITGNGASGPSPGSNVHPSAAAATGPRRPGDAFQSRVSSRWSAPAC